MGWAGSAGPHHGRQLEGRPLAGGRLLLFLFPPRAVLPTPVLSCGVRFTWELVLWELVVSGVWMVQRGSVSAGRIGRVLCSRLGVCA